MKAKLSSKYQLVIPKIAREAMGLRKGDRVSLVPKGNCLILLKTPPSYTESKYGLLRPKKRESLLTHLKKSRSKW